MNGVRITSTFRSRVYTMAATCLLLVLAGLAGAPGAQAPAEHGAEPAMVKGAATAAVTIVEYSDYQ